MELIRTLDTRISKSGKSKHIHAIFLCSYCLQEVEKEFGNGKLAKSCGCVRYKLSAESNKGKKHTEETRQKIKDNHADTGGKNCYWFGKNLTEEHKQKVKDNHADFSGENNPMYGKRRELSPNWNNGSSFEIYPPEFNKYLKKYILKRDNYTCQCPNCEHLSERLEVHHIDYDKKNNLDDNLITLCKNCHAKTISKNKRIYYTEFYSEIVSVYL